MSPASGSDARGIYADATGVKWTVGVGIVVDIVATVWLLQWLDPAGGQPMPLSGLVTMLQPIGVEAPGWLIGFTDWLHVSRAVLLWPLFALAFLLLLQSTHARYDLLYRPATVALVLVLMEAHGSAWPAVWLVLLLAAVSVVAALSGAAERRSRSGTTREDRFDYFGSLPAGHVLGQGLLVLLPPVGLILLIASAVRDAYTLRVRRELWPEFRKSLERLQRDDPVAAEGLRTEALLRLADRDERAFDRSMIEYVLVSAEPPSGAPPIGRIRPVL
ncbi:hypothetical protein [Microbacterium sp.]|uniref:hypothetical protein n=1 Tax=Microbacterium sp. TaxID=51671 RepID=UPI0033409D0E